MECSGPVVEHFFLLVDRVRRIEGARDGALYTLVLVVYIPLPFSSRSNILPPLLVQFGVGRRKAPKLVPQREDMPLGIDYVIPIVYKIVRIE